MIIYSSNQVVRVGKCCDVDVHVNRLCHFGNLLEHACLTFDSFFWPNFKDRRRAVSIQQQLEDVNATLKSQILEQAAQISELKSNSAEYATSDKVNVTHIGLQHILVLHNCEHYVIQTK